MKGNMPGDKSGGMSGLSAAWVVEVSKEWIGHHETHKTHERRKTAECCYRMVEPGLPPSPRLQRTSRTGWLDERI
jgi:hypothetical protein